MFKRSVFFRKRKYNLLVGFISLLIITSSVNAQTFKSSNVKLYDFFNRFFIQEIPIEVLGLPNAMNDSFGLESIQLSLHHNRTSDLKIQLQAPDGTTVWVTNRNGGLDGKNYIKTHFSQYGKNGLINTGKSPFTGNYIPDGQMTYFNNGSNPNGIWKLLVEDLKEGEEGVLDSVGIVFGKKPAYIVQKKYCSMLLPELCSCSKTSCELLPDLLTVPAFTNSQYHEFAYNDPMYPGQLKIAVAIANIGLGPLEVGPDSSLIGDCCGGDTTQVPANTRYDLFQRIYSKTEKVLTSRTVKTGTIYYENMPGHHHYHVDDWIEMRLVKIVNGKRKLMCKGAKVSYCLFTTGMLYEKENSSLINGKKYGTTMTNYALGEYYACSLAKQGISVGGYDYYGMMYEGQYLQLPVGLKNGEYILEIEIDPDHKYKESDRSNNTLQMKVNIQKQRQ
ncbi:MAG: proprotein convertase P-domain-containing protein [Chitinophagaceae bacterium]|nr:proprotein convertase P-domain-containing protein [Chitinophagaceae bacterium]